MSELSEAGPEICKALQTENPARTAEGPGGNSNTHKSLECLHAWAWPLIILGACFLCVCCCRITEFPGLLFFWLLKLVHCTSGTIHQPVGRGKGSPSQGPVRGARVLEISKQSPHNPAHQQGREWTCESRGDVFRRLTLVSTGVRDVSWSQ